jgi:hypothetical protein
MNAADSINDLSHDEIRLWLERALRGEEPLPRLTPDESHYLGILRLEKSLKPAARDSLRDACRELARRFCADGKGETAYLEELLSLVSTFKDRETVEGLSALALTFLQWPEMALEVRFAVLATLVDTPPPRKVEFWQEILMQNPEQYASMALSGVLAINPSRAITMLPRLLNSERVGQAAALKLDLAWDTLLPKQRFRFVQEVEAILPNCGSDIAVPLASWILSKQSSSFLDEILRKLESPTNKHHITGTDAPTSAFHPIAPIATEPSQDASPLQHSVKSSTVSVKSSTGVDLVRKSSLYRQFEAEKEEIMRHKWIESQKAEHDIGFKRALTDWIIKNRSKWRKSRLQRQAGSSSEGRAAS